MCFFFYHLLRFALVLSGQVWPGWKLGRVQTNPHYQMTQSFMNLIGNAQDNAPFKLPSPAIISCFLCKTFYVPPHHKHLLFILCLNLMSLILALLYATLDLICCFSLLMPFLSTQKVRGVCSPLLRVLHSSLIYWPKYDSAMTGGYVAYFSFL